MPTGYTNRFKGKAAFAQTMTIDERRFQTTGITAHAGGGQSAATQLGNGINHVTTVATIADSVKLPPSVAGMIVYVINGATNSMQVYGTSPDTINGVATGTGVALAGNTGATYVCPVAGKWFAC